ncbi:MAG TPA: hypothetical protein VHT30_01550 [Acidimicrobiales bacterium]|nr:hypothetical protein [Acidimicrobiales bacterium]
MDLFTLAVHAAIALHNADHYGCPLPYGFWRSGEFRYYHHMAGLTGTDNMIIATPDLRGVEKW